LKSGKPFKHRSLDAIGIVQVLQQVIDWLAVALNEHPFTIKGKDQLKSVHGKAFRLIFHCTK